MGNLQADLRTAFEDEGYEVSGVSENRGQVRIELLEEAAKANALREITFGVVDEDDVVGWNVSTETADGQGVRTVVSFRQRS